MTVCECLHGSGQEGCHCVALHPVSSPQPEESTHTKGDEYIVTWCFGLDLCVCVCMCACVSVWQRKYSDLLLKVVLTNDSATDLGPEPSCKHNIGIVVIRQKVT